MTGVRNNLLPSLPVGQLDENQWLLFNLEKNDLGSDDINLVPNAEISKCDIILNSLVDIDFFLCVLF